MAKKLQARETVDLKLFYTLHTFSQEGFFCIAKHTSA